MLFITNVGAFYSKQPIPAGKITRGKVLELLPFTTNSAAYVELKGSFVLAIIARNEQVGICFDFVVVDGLRYEMVLRRTGQAFSEVDMPIPVEGMRNAMLFSGMELWPI